MAKINKKERIKRVSQLVITFVMVLICVCLSCFPCSAISAQPISPSLYPNGTESTMYTDLYAKRLFTPFTLWISDRNQVDGTINDNFAYGVHFETVIDNSYFQDVSSSIDVNYDRENVDYGANWVNSVGIELVGYNGASESEQWYKGFYRIRPSNTIDGQNDNNGFNSSQYFIQSGGYVYRPYDLTIQENTSYIRFNENLDDVTRGLITSVSTVDTIEYIRGGIVEKRTTTQVYNIDYDKRVIDIAVIPTELIDPRGNEPVYILNSTRQITVYNNGSPFENVTDPYVWVCGALDTWYYMSGYEFFTNTSSAPDSTVAYQTGYNNGYDDGYNYGYNRGNEIGRVEGIESLDFTGWLAVAVGGFLDFQLFGNITIGGMLAVCVAIGLVMAFLKIFSGG